MTETKQLTELVGDVVRLREAKQSYDDEYNIHLEAWKQEHQKLIAGKEAAKEILEQAEAELRTATIVAFKATGNRKPAPTEQRSQDVGDLGPARREENTMRKWTPSEMRAAAAQSRRELGLLQHDSLELPEGGAPFWRLTLSDLTDEQLVGVMERVRQVREASQKGG